MTPSTQIEHYAKVPRRVVLHQMKTAVCFDDRVFWALVLWSWCGPQSCDHVVVKDSKGFIQKRASGEAIDATRRDILILLKRDPDATKGNLSRSLQRLEAKGSLRIEGKTIYLYESPRLIEESKEGKRLSFTIAGIVIKAELLPSEPIARAEAIKFLEELKSGYNSSLTTLRTGYRKLLVQGIAERPFLNTKKKKRREEGSQPVGPVQEQAEPPEQDRPTDPTPEPQAATPEPTIEEVRALITEETAATHPEDVPGDAVCRDTVANLRGAPTERLRSAIRAKFRPRDKIGRIAYLAKDVGDRWETEKQERQKLEAAQRNQEREALEWMAENDESEENRKFARAKLAWFT